MSNKSTTEDEGGMPLLRETTPTDDAPPNEHEHEPDLVGSSLGRFHVRSLLGKGGMGLVYLAEDEALGREVALKVLAPEAAEDRERRRRLLREARAAAAVTHSSIAAVYEVGEAKGLLYIAMERVQGDSLRARLEKGPISIESAVRIAKRALEGLAQAHEAGIVHRDLKPDNVMVDGSDHVKILDFGLAKFTREEKNPGPVGTTLTEEGRLLGTPSYMSPEQAAGLPLDVRSDVFSFGIIFYEMVTGQPPFQGANFLKVLAAIERDEPAPPSKKNAAIPPEVERVILRCLRKEPADRYANAREILLDLENGRSSPNPRGRAQVWVGGAMAGVVLLAAGVAMLGGRMESGATEPIPSAPISSQSAAALAPVPTAVTELPLPKTNSPEALAAYREGMQALRDGAWGNAYTAFKRVVELDPSLGAGHLRLAYTGTWYADGPEDVRASYRKAISMRDMLSEHDRRLLEVLSPVLQQDPPDPAEAERRIEAAQRDFPGDAEWVSMQGNALFTPNIGPAKVLEAANRCLALDPRYADCWQGQAHALARLGRVEEALRSVDRCLEVSPAATDCVLERRGMRQSMGQCAAMEADLRAIIANDSNNWAPYRALATALLAQGRSPATVRVALEQGWQKAPAQAKTLWSALDDVQFEYLAGQFEEAERRTLAWARTKAQSPLEGVHGSVLTRLVLHYEVLGRTKEAGAAADEYLSGRDVWAKPFLRAMAGDVTLFAAKRKLNAGSMSRAEYLAAHSAYVEGWKKRLSPDMHGLVWLLADAELAQTAEEARAALDGKPELMPLEYYAMNPVRLRSAFGNVYLLAGEPAQAIPYLEKAAADCGVFFRPIEHTLDHYRLGIAKEAISDKVGACAAYEIVIDRWGKAKPRVPAATDAGVRAKALRCAM